MKTLIAEGYLRAVDRRGTFVADTLPGSDTADPVPLADAPDRLARFPRGAVVGVVTPVSDSETVAFLGRHDAYEVVAAFERYVSEFEGVTQIFGHDEVAGRAVMPIEATQRAISAGCDAILVALSYNRWSAEPLIVMAENAGIPVVFAGSEPLREPAVSIYYDNVGAGYQAAEHLVQAGVESVAFFAHYVDWWVYDRAKGAQQAIAGARADKVSFATYPLDLFERGPSNDGEVAQPPDHAKVAYERAKLYLADGLPACGIVAANDRCAIAFMDAASERGLAAGRDYAIIAFDDEPRSKFSQLSTLKPPWDQMGREAGRLLVNAMTARRRTTSRVCLPAQLVARMSSRFVDANQSH